MDIEYYLNISNLLNQTLMKTCKKTLRNSFKTSIVQKMLALGKIRMNIKC